MSSNRETFWNNSSFALVGHSAKKNFPVLTYRGLKMSGKKVFPIDPEASEIEGDKAYPDFGSLPEKVDAVILELPKEETAEWVGKAAEAGLKDIWLHQKSDTPEALALAEKKGMNVRYGTCAVMYVTPGLTFHSIHKWVMKLTNNF